MLRDNKLNPVLAALLLMFCIAACSDDDNPVDPGPTDPNPIDTTRNDTIRIDSIDALTICPPQEVTIFGQNFPTDKSQLSLQIGGLPAEITELSDSQLTTVVPWNIQSGRIELLDADAQSLAAFESMIAPDCRTGRLPSLEIELTAGMLACPCEIFNFDIILQEVPSEPHKVLLFIEHEFVGDFFLNGMRRTAGFRVNRDMFGKQFVLKDEDLIEVYRSPQGLIQDNFCRADYSAQMDGLTVETLRTIFKKTSEPEVESTLNLPASLRDISVVSIEQNSCLFRFRPDNQRRVDEHKTYFEQDTAVFETLVTSETGNGFNSPHETEVRQHQLRVIHTSDSNTPQYIELRYNYHQVSIFFESTISETFESYKLRINPDKIVDGKLHLTESEIPDNITCEYFREGWESNSWETLVLVSTSESTTDRPTVQPGAFVNIQFSF